MKTNLPTLARISVASPCSADWEQMTGDDRIRYCKTCRKNVYDLTEMTAEEAMRLIEEKEGKLCARFYQRSDGTVLTADCPVGTDLRIRRRVKQAGWSAAASVLLIYGYYGVSYTQGAICVSPACRDDESKLEPEILPMPREIENMDE